MVRSNKNSIRGASLIEYALLLGMLSLALIGALIAVGTSIDNRLNDLVNNFNF